MFKNLSIRTRTVTLVATYSVFLVVLALVNFFIARYLVELPSNEEADILWKLGIIDIALIAIATAIAIPIAVATRRYVSSPLVKMNEELKKLATGNTNVEFKHRNTDEVGQLADSFRRIVEAIKYENSVLDNLADGDYSAKIQLRAEDDDMFKSIRDIVETNRAMLKNLNQISQQVYSAAAQLSTGAQSLAHGSGEQTATLDGFTQVIENVQNQAEDNAFKSGAMLVTIEENMGIMERIIADMDKMTKAMNDITVSSKKVASVIHVIEEIAFQTNILSLNASVEAARAGSNGRGFAVVADEVKELAAKSADAARETAALIETNISTVEAGNSIVETTKLSVTDIERMTRATKKGMTDLNDASISQSTSITNITSDIDQLTSVAQSNAAMAEEYSASAEELTAQSEHLTGLVGNFKLDALDE